MSWPDVVKKLRRWGFNVYLLPERINIVGNSVDIHVSRNDEVDVGEAYVSFKSGDGEVSIWRNGCVHVRI
jgi:hypothetical protein